MKTITYLIVCGIFLMFSCKNNPQVNLESEIMALHKTDSDWSNTCLTRDPDRFIEYYDNDAYLFDSDGQEYRGKDRLREHISGVFSLPNNLLTWKTNNIYVSKSGDLGVTSGIWNLDWTTETGDSLNGYGPLLLVWKKQPDGSWKNIITSAISMKK